MEKIQIKSWLTDKILYECDIPEELKDAELSEQLGYVVRKAVSEEANLSEENLAWAYLLEANLSWANIEGAYILEENLSEDNLAWAYLLQVDLYGENLVEASLEKADLYGVKIYGAILTNTILGKGE
jgi:uncharacterized protein YjbI with pentapeptide repeats